MPASSSGGISADDNRISLLVAGAPGAADADAVTGGGFRSTRAAGAGGAGFAGANTGRGNGIGKGSVSEAQPDKDRSPTAATTECKIRRDIGRVFNRQEAEIAIILCPCTEGIR
jgi:hypothetical protein